MADSGGSMGSVVSLCMRESHPTHEIRQVAIAMRLQEQVPEIAHNTISAQPHRKQRRTIGQYLLEGRKVVFFVENPQTPVDAIEHMVNIPT
jgi:hypothetical protein